MKSTPDTASPGFSVMVIRAPVRVASASAIATMSAGGCSGDEPATAVTLVAILGTSATLDFAWKNRGHYGETDSPSNVLPNAPQQAEEPL